MTRILYTLFLIVFLVIATPIVLVYSIIEGLMLKVSERDMEG